MVEAWTLAPHCTRRNVMGAAVAVAVGAAGEDAEEEHGCHVTVGRSEADSVRGSGLGTGGGIAADRDSIADQALGRDGAGVTAAAKESVVSWRQRTSAAGRRSGRQRDAGSRPFLFLLILNGVPKMS